MNQKLISIKEIIKKMYGSGFQPKNIQECLLAGAIELFLITVGLLLGYFLAVNFFGSKVNACLLSYFVYMFAIIASFRFIKYFFLFWKYKRK